MEDSHLSPCKAPCAQRALGSFGEQGFAGAAGMVWHMESQGVPGWKGATGIAETNSLLLTGLLKLNHSTKSTQTLFALEAWCHDHWPGELFQHPTPSGGGKGEKAGGKGEEPFPNVQAELP